MKHNHEKPKSATKDSSTTRSFKNKNSDGNSFDRTSSKFSDRSSRLSEFNNKNKGNAKISDKDLNTMPN